MVALSDRWCRAAGGEAEVAGDGWRSWFRSGGRCRGCWIHGWCGEYWGSRCLGCSAIFAVRGMVDAGAAGAAGGTAGQGRHLVMLMPAPLQMCQGLFRHLVVPLPAPWQWYQDLCRHRVVLMPAHVQLCQGPVQAPGDADAGSLAMVSEPVQASGGTATGSLAIASGPVQAHGGADAEVSRLARHRCTGALVEKEHPGGRLDDEGCSRFCNYGSSRRCRGHGECGRGNCWRRWCCTACAGTW
jgi:hypothetical protein